MRSNPRSEEVMEIGKRIRELRLKKNMSQADLADKANISLSQVSDIETGKSSMRLTTFIGIVEALQVSADVLLRPDIPGLADKMCLSRYQPEVHHHARRIGSLQKTCRSRSDA